MSDIFQIRMTWAGGDSAPFVTTLYAQENDTSIADARAAISDFLSGDVSGQFSDDFTWTIPSSGDILDTNTGGLIGTWTDGTPISDSGADTGNRVADASQVLVQLRTGDIVSGRELRGRFFLPGLRVTALSAGNLDSSTLTTIETEANDNLNGVLAVFSRTHHEWATVTSCSVWSELAVLRSRR